MSDEEYNGNVVIERMYKILYAKYAQTLSYALREVERVAEYGENVQEMKKELQRIGNVEKLVDSKETVAVVRALEECLGINSIFSRMERKQVT